MRVRPSIAALAAAAFVVTHACSTREPATPGASRASEKEAQALRIAYLANLTHAPAVFALEGGLIANGVGDGVKLTSHVFHAGPEIVQALFSGDIDIAFVGPNPAINAYQKSGHAAVRIIAGATSGGAALVVDRAITGPEALRGKKLATPQLGNTQDVALRAWLRDRGLKADLQGGGDVAILPQENAQALEAFRAHRIDGGWVPEPWASRLVLEGEGHVLVDEATLWPDGRYATTVVLARTEYLTTHRDVVDRFLRAHVAAIAGLQDDPARAAKVVNAGLARITGKALGDELLRAAWGRLAFTADPLVATLARSAARAKDAGLLPDADIGGIADLGLLNGVLRQLGKPEVGK